MANRPCDVFKCARSDAYRPAAIQNGRVIGDSNSKSTFDFVKSQLCTASVGLTLFNSVRLPREAFRHGSIPYLVLYSFWLLVACLPSATLQLAMGQLSRQDPVGIWRAVPILRGVGHLKLLTSYICSIYNMIYVGLTAAYLLWIIKGAFPIKDCVRLHLTPNGYETRINATECFNSTFSSTFMQTSHYFCIMAILIFTLWFLLPLLLYKLSTSLKYNLMLLAPITLIAAIIYLTLTAKNYLFSMSLTACEQWLPLLQANIWQSTLVQSLLSTQIVSGYLISSGGSVYKNLDVRWTSCMMIFVNLLAAWFWVFLWEGFLGNEEKENGFLAPLIWIYLHYVAEKRPRQWLILSFGIVFLSGIITMLILMFPVYVRIHRLAGDYWRMFVTLLSIIGTVLTVTLAVDSLEVASAMDELIVPVLTLFTVAVEIAGFIFIYGWSNISTDFKFLTGAKLPCLWIATWWAVPLAILGVGGWWLRGLLQNWDHDQGLWPLAGVFVGILVVMTVDAGIAVAKEEQFNLISKIASAFSPSRLWGPEESLARYVWMSHRFTKKQKNNVNTPENNYPQMIAVESYDEEFPKTNGAYQRSINLYDNGNSSDRDAVGIYTTHIPPKHIYKWSTTDKFRSPNICIARNRLDAQVDCNCNRHFTLNVPHLRNDYNGAEKVTNL